MTDAQCANVKAACSGRKLSEMHKARISRALAGRVLGPRYTGPRNPAWRGGRIISSGGYVEVRVGGKYMKEHRVIMAEMLGRPMLPFPQETVHHKNGNKQDNRPENLELRTGQHGHGATIHCLTCTCQG